MAKVERISKQAGEKTSRAFPNVRLRERKALRTVVYSSLDAVVVPVVELDVGLTLWGST